MSEWRTVLHLDGAPQRLDKKVGYCTIQLVNRKGPVAGWRMMKVVTAYTAKTQLGRILRELRENDRFVILRRNLPVGILLSIQDYVKEHSDQFRDVEDFIDTLLEEGDPQFQRSLKKAARETRQGRYLSHTELKLALANKKFR